jgi:dihydrofolate reductase
VAQAPGAPEEDPDGGFTHGGWQAPLMDDESGSVMFERARSMDALLLGRRTYEIFANYWPTAPQEVPFTGLLNGVPRYVVSHTLADKCVAGIEANREQCERYAEGITAIKERYDEVHVIGSLDLVQSPVALRLVDRLRPWLYPLLLGRGKQVFANGTVPAALRLTESVTYPNGTLQLAVRRRPECPHTATSPSRVGPTTTQNIGAASGTTLKRERTSLELQTCHCEVIDLAEVRDATGALPRLRRAGP